MEEAPFESRDDEIEEELSTEDLAESNNILLSALIEVLIKKGVVTQEEIDAEAEEIAAEDEDEDEVGVPPPPEQFLQRPEHPAPPHPAGEHPAPPGEEHPPQRPEPAPQGGAPPRPGV